MELHICKAGGASKDHVVVIPQLFVDLIFVPATGHGHQHVDGVSHRNATLIAGGFALLVLVGSNIGRRDAIAGGRDLHHLCVSLLHDRASIRVINNQARSVGHFPAIRSWLQDVDARAVGACEVSRGTMNAESDVGR